jgi:hypothetical protein
MEAAGHYVELRTASGAHLVRESIATLQRRLDPARFVRIHRSTIVNVDKVMSCAGVSREFEVVLAGGAVCDAADTLAADLTRVLSPKRIGRRRVRPRTFAEKSFDAGRVRKREGARDPGGYERQTLRQRRERRPRPARTNATGRFVDLR